MNIITAHCDVDRRTLGKDNQQAAQNVMNEIMGKIAAHLMDGSPWLIQLNDWSKRESATNFTTRIIRTAGIAPFGELIPALATLNSLVRDTRLGMQIWRSTHPGEPFKNDNPKQVLVDERLLIAILDTISFPIVLPKEKDSNPQALS